MKNESGKHYVSLDRDDITCYPDEMEILLQAGLSAKVNDVKEIEEESGDRITIIDLYISEK